MSKYLNYLTKPWNMSNIFTFVQVVFLGINFTALGYIRWTHGKDLSMKGRMANDT